MFAKFRQRIKIKYFMVAYLGSLWAYSCFALHRPIRFLAGALIIVLYSLFDLAWTRVEEHVWYVPVSSWISALVLSIVALSPGLSIVQVVFLPLLAVLSKHLLRLGKNRHIWNPAAFAMATLNLFVPAVSWWAVSWGTIPLAIVIVVGLFILWRQNRWHVTVPFLVSYSVFSALTLLSAGSGAASALKTLPSLLLDGTLLFFATVMLVEPVTSTFPTRRQRSIYGVLVGFFAAATSFMAQIFPQVRVDPLIIGLLIGNVIASLSFLPSPQKTVAA